MGPRPFLYLNGQVVSSGPDLRAFNQHLREARPTQKLALPACNRKLWLIFKAKVINNRTEINPGP
jgi:hypothetical protein